MQKKTLRRVAFTAIVAPALALGASTMASADAYYESETNKAGPNGAYSHLLKAKSGDGETWFHESHSKANEDGAHSSSTTSGSD